MHRTPLFPSSPPIAVVPPEVSPDWGEDEQRRVRDLPLLFESARGALERELGAPFQIVPTDPGRGSRWLVRVGGTPEPTLSCDRKQRLLITDGPDVDGAFETFSYLRGLSHQPDGVRPIRDLPSAEQAFDQIEQWVTDSWPSLSTRRPHWKRICSAHRPRVLAAKEPVHALRIWLAELSDAHTTLRPPHAPYDLPYTVHLTPQRAVLHAVPEDSEGWRAGARPGMQLHGLDLAGLHASAGASAHMRPFHAGRLAMRGPEREVELTAGPGRLRWRELRRRATYAVTSTRPSDDIGMVRFDAFLPHLESALHEAIDAHAGAGLLVIDLRDNGGGNIHVARRLQQRFLREKTTLGVLRTSAPGGALGPEEKLINEPHHPWPGTVRFLTSPRTYSAAEDLLLGLQGLPHVQVWGEPSGGGSGRVRTLRTLPGWRLTVSTALTWDRRKRLIEGNGIPVDKLIRSG